MHDDWIDLFKLLHANGAKYLVVGGYAVALYGFERHTKDVDLWIARDEKNATAVIDSLVEFGFPRSALKKSSFLDPKKVIVLGAEPFRVDIITELDALEFEKAWTNRVTRKLQRVPIHYVSLKHLRILRSDTGRFVDERDLGALAYCKELPGAKSAASKRKRADTRPKSAKRRGAGKSEQKKKS